MSVALPRSHMSRSLYIYITFGFMAVVMLSIQSCCGDICQLEREAAANRYGGGQDAITIDLPFDVGYTAQCVQGANGSYSHRYTSTRYDADFDTPNNVRDPVYAPVDGVAYVHDTDRTTNFGVHINVDMGDGTYVILGHLDQVFVDDGSDVAAGQLLGFEGTTGASTGDHVHMGRHDGDASKDGRYGTSIAGLMLNVDDVTGSRQAAVSTSDLVCSLTSGHQYASLLTTPRWHPDGSLVKTPEESTVYVIESGNARPFVDEASFWSRGYDFGDVALVSDNELGCFGAGSTVSGNADVGAVYDRGVVWLVVDNGGGTALRHRVASTGWQGVLKSWGIVAATYDDLPTASTNAAFTASGEATGADFRDGSLVSEVSSSTVYVMSGGIAMPIETWDDYLLLGFENRTVIEVDDGVVGAIMGAVGDCGMNAYCVTRSDIVMCGGPSGDDEGTYPDGDVGGVDTGAATRTEDSGATEDSAPVGEGGLVVTWSTSSGAAADRITLSGEYSHESGWSEGWQTLGESRGLPYFSYEVIDAEAGDALRFSVEFVEGSNTSWSCLAPFPPGTVQGNVTATYRGSAVSVAAVDDPSSNGCGLSIIVP